jgi:hypothetical protein
MHMGEMKGKNGDPWKWKLWLIVKPLTSPPKPLQFRMEAREASA